MAEITLRIDLPSAHFYPKLVSKLRSSEKAFVTSKLGVLQSLDKLWIHPPLHRNDHVSIQYEFYPRAFSLPSQGDLEDCPFIPNILGETYLNITRMHARLAQGIRNHRLTL